jgi:DNA-binding NtrC family response regulator
MIAPRILVVGGEPTTLYTISAMAGSSYRAEESAIGAEVLARVHGEPTPDLVLLELGNGNGIGLQTLQQLRAIQPDLTIVVLSVSGDTRQVVEALRLGARDYLNAPLQPVELQQVLSRCLGPKMSTAVTTDSTGTVEELDEGVFFVAASPAMRKVRIQAELLANIDAPVLLLGESGTGKEVIAHLLHKLSSRSRSRFLKVNCAALPGELLESELFGYERGAFTGAMRTKQGKFELCHKGTILLDEVAEMPTNLQAKLLHVLQDRQFYRLGGETTIQVDARILAATNVNVHQAIAERKFRQDLYYRLNAFTICLPPLRERQEEIPLLLQHFMERTATQYARPPIRFSPPLIEACLRYPWPGNLRELENFVKRYLVIRDEAVAIAELRANWRPHQSVKDLLPVPTASRLEVLPTGGEAHGSEMKSVLRTLKDETEAQAITKALKETLWNRKRAARLLSISYRGLLYKISKHGITRGSASQITPFFPNGESAT